MEFDVNLKKMAIRFYDKCFKKNIPFQNEDSLFTYIVFNIPYSQVLIAFRMFCFIFCKMLTQRAQR